MSKATPIEMNSCLQVLKSIGGRNSDAGKIYDNYNDVPKDLFEYGYNNSDFKKYEILMQLLEKNEVSDCYSKFLIGCYKFLSDKSIF